MFGPVLVLLYKFVCGLVFSCLSFCMCVYQAIEFSCCTVVPLRSTVPPSPSIIHPPGARLRCCYSSSSFKIEIHIHLDDCVQQTVPHVWKLRINLLFPICPVFFSFDFWLNTAGWYMGVERVMGFCIFFPNWWKVQRERERLREFEKDGQREPRGSGRQPLDLRDDSHPTMLCHNALLFNTCWEKSKICNPRNTKHCCLTQQLEDSNSCVWQGTFLKAAEVWGSHIRALSFRQDPTISQIAKID